jgi:uncharacterized protein with von Willebrand factor type A (vWA) domain
MNDEENYTVITINGKEYLTFPQALDYLKANREKLRTRVLKDIPLSYLEKEKKKVLETETEEKLDELKGMGLTKENVEKFIAMMKAEEQKKKK